MNNQLNDPETVAKRLRFEAKFLRKRFPFRSGGAAADKRQDIREKSDQSLASPPTSASHQNCEISKCEAKVGEGSDDAMLERLAVAELLQEAAKSKARADVGGPSEWSKKPARVNKRFVANSLLQTESQNKRKSSTSKTKE
ncbi:uncharacterized protein LOC130688685 [Daphnia carinata]|uniref:uncharacterized protein LOC130688685 n=1 Tax=Daphnia carinata TaxID=120202 RepID=UPI00258026A0|nr:uncharacterized protein LOC130688685 [Daphnia carinata]